MSSVLLVIFYHCTSVAIDVSVRGGATIDQSKTPGRKQCIISFINLCTKSFAYVFIKIFKIHILSDRDCNGQLQDGKRWSRCT